MEQSPVPSPAGPLETAPATAPGLPADPDRPVAARALSPNTTTTTTTVPEVRGVKRPAETAASTETAHAAKRSRANAEATPAQEEKEDGDVAAALHEADKGEEAAIPSAKDMLMMPVQPTVRIMKRALPSNCTISKDIKEPMARAAGLFILYLTNTAGAVARSKNHKSITAEDVIEALPDMDFAELQPVLQGYHDEQLKKRAKK